MTRASISRRFFLTTLIACSIVWIAWGLYCERYANSERTRQIELDRVTLRQLVENTHKICARLGHVPRDQVELESRLGRPMPQIHDDGIVGGRVERAVHFSRTGDNSFQLHYELWSTDDWTYDSTKQEVGWVRSFY